jgi:hypothetical protein
MLAMDGWNGKRTTTKQIGILLEQVQVQVVPYQKMDQSLF